MEMPLYRRRLLVGTALLAVAGLTAPFAVGGKKPKPTGTATSTSMDEQKRAVHALNRLTFGPRPGDVERVNQMGVDKWIELELHPDKINDSALDARLSSFRTLRMGTKEIVENFPPNQVIKQIADGKASLPRDPTKRAVYEAQLQRYEDKQERKEETSKSNSANAVPNAVMNTQGPNADQIPTDPPVETGLAPSPGTTISLRSRSDATPRTTPPRESKNAGTS